MVVGKVAVPLDVVLVADGTAATTPTHSIPNIRGSLTPGEAPRRVKCSDLFRPNAFICIRIWWGRGLGMGRVVKVRVSGPPGWWRMAAFILGGWSVVDSGEGRGGRVHCFWGVGCGAHFGLLIRGSRR